MTKRLVFGLCAAAALVCAPNPFAQEREDRTLLSHDQMRAIVSEASGERAMHHVMELVPYPRIRPISEYQGHFRESEVMAGFAKEYGFSSVEIESFPSQNRSWAPTMGELWLMTPTEQKKLYDIHDIAVSVAANSQNGDVTGELVDVGLGTRAADYAGKDLKGKVAIGAGGVGQIFALATERGAIGAVGYSTLYPDHVTYMQHGIPAVMFITWPDNWYHSSQDTPDKQDSTQYKRAAVVATGAMAVLATGGDELAARVVSENLSRGTERMGESYRKALSYIADASGQSLASAYRDAIVTIRQQANVEKGVVRSARVLFDSPADGDRKVQVFEPLIDKRAAALLDEAKAAYALQASQRRVSAQPVLTPEEREASSLLIECVNGSSLSGCAAAPGAGGGRAGGGGRGGASGLPQHMTAEATILLGQKKSVLEFRDFLACEFDPVPLADVMTYLRAREQAGAIRLVKR